LLDDGGLSPRSLIDGARGAGGEWGRLISRRLFGGRGATAVRAALVASLAWAAALSVYMFVRLGYPLAMIALEVFKGHGGRAFGGLLLMGDVSFHEAMLVGVIGLNALCISGPIWALFHVSEPRGRWVTFARGAATAAVVGAALWL
jgi:hypothetical protein